MPQTVQASVDKRVGKLSGTADWIRPATLPFQRSGGNKANDWKLLLQCGAEYCFGDDVPEQCREAFWDMLQVLRDLLDATCDVHDVNMAGPSPQELHLRQLRRRAVLALAKMERDVPATEHAIIMHIIIHVPAAIYRWNSVKNTWAFHSER